MNLNSGLKFGAALLLCMAQIAACTFESKESEPAIAAGNGLTGRHDMSGNVSNAGDLLSKENVKDWVGFYKILSPRCTILLSSGDCSNEFTDCLRVRERGGEYAVELYSVQAQQHLCSFNLIMVRNGAELSYADTGGHKFRLSRDGGKLVLTTSGFIPSPGFCGAHGSLEGIEFPISSKQQTDDVCFQDE